MDEGRRADGVYEFGDFRLLAAQRSLTARSDGRPIELTQKAFDTLRYLVQHPGELLDKSALMAAVWPNVVVEENNLNQVISALRRTLGDGNGGRRFIVTVPGRGYQFVAPVRELEAPAATQPPTLIPSGDTVAAERKSIAVLPFASLSSDPERDHFGDGIAEELIHLLTRVPGLKVPARTSSFAYKGRNIDVRQIARELGVTMLLEGSVRSAGDRIRVTAQLIEADSGFHVWSQSYDRRFADVFQLQDELAGAIVQALRISMSDGPRPLWEVPPTQNVEAYRLYLLARGLRDAPQIRGERIIELLEESIRLDPTFARAHSELGWIRYLLFNLGLRGPEILVDARRSAERALALEPEAPDAHAVIGIEHAMRGEWCAAETSLRRAIELDPREVQARFVYAVMVLGSVGRLREALDEARAGFELAPADAGGAVTLAGFSSSVGQDQDAALYVGVAVDLGIPSGQLPLPIFSSEIARRAGQYTLASRHLLPVLPASVRDHGGDDVVGLVYTALADRNRASEAVARLRALREKVDPAIIDNWPMVMLSIIWYAMLGALDDAYETAQRIVQTFRRTGILNAINLPPLWIPELRPFRLDPRFQTFVTDLRLTEYWSERGPPDGCKLDGNRLVVVSA